MPKNHYARWTDEEIDSVFFMRSKGKTDAEIAEVLGRSVSAITNAVHRERKRNTDLVDVMVTQQAQEPRKSISREELLKELLPGLNALFGSELEKYEEQHSSMVKKPTLLERIKLWLGIGR